ncbi:hypothetical protein OESDEN_05798 [Oesophagostomum dentatum]|uniref:CC domain-containing protein n=1 Tax=Oesophagostomum dentatum TaxID=61180 RepID=A0A0B1TFU5_OESDE|nr:hypothetical protein OESDEN_05798 [Oesophagostomum dentatum]
MKLQIVALLSTLCSLGAKEITRSKRQVQAYYMCGGYGNGYISNTGCGNYNGCGSNCGGSTAVIIPNSFYSPASNCQTSCSSINCNQYSGQYINGQYVATLIGNNQYSPCASSCCSSGWNNWNSGFPMWGNSMVISGNGYNPYTTNSDYMFGNGVQGINTNPLTQAGPGPVVISTNVQRMPSVASAFTGTFSNGVLLCGGTEPSGGSCAGNGQCPTGHSCMAGNVCCRCAVGASSGTCPSGSDLECPIGYACSPTLSCCPSQGTGHPH